MTFGLRLDLSPLRSLLNHSRFFFVELLELEIKMSSPTDCTPYIKVNYIPLKCNEGLLFCFVLFVLCKGKGMTN